MSRTPDPETMGYHEAVMHEALTAIVARLKGEYDNPAIEAFGPLSESTRDDILRLAQEALTA
jgi:hypothetical protein